MLYPVSGLSETPYLYYLYRIHVQLSICNLINSDYFYIMADPVGRQINSAAVSA